MPKGKILVVDDETYLLQILDFSLGAEGYEVVMAENGQQAVEKAVGELPDLIVLDIVMPVIDGYAACRQIKHDERTKDIPVILLTAKGRDIDRKLGLEVGADDYITKPFSPAKLIAKIASFLDE